MGDPDETPITDDSTVSVETVSGIRDRRRGLAKHYRDVRNRGGGPLDRARLPHVKAIVLKKTGHWLMEENPTETMEALKAFLS